MLPLFLRKLLVRSKIFDVTQCCLQKMHGEWISSSIMEWLPEFRQSRTPDLKRILLMPKELVVSIGSGIGGLPMIEETRDEFVATGVRKISPFFVPGSIINMISGNLSIMYGFGPNIALVSACSTGTHSIGDAGRLIEYGDADIMIAGAECTLSPLGLGGFCTRTFDVTMIL